MVGSSPSEPPTSVPPPPPATSASWFSALRAALTMLVFLLILSGIAYPFSITAVSQLVTPETANGSLLAAPNGTVYGSSLLGENVTNPGLFWLRPSLIDDQAFTGAGGEVPFGPSDPALVNATLAYARTYNVSNVSVPLNLVSPSASGLDPDIQPAAAFLQIPRVAYYDLTVYHIDLNQSWLLDFVNAHVQYPLFGLFGAKFVNVLALDVDLLQHLPPGTTVTVR